MKHRLFIIVLLLECMLPKICASQSIPFKVLFSKSECLLSKPDSHLGISISNFKFYISDVRFYKDDSLVNIGAEKYQLIDLLDTNKNKIIYQQNNSNFNGITFNLGIDSITNVSGAMEGDLDPMNNMYWTWQSGYINLKFEGQLDDGVKREYHLGGYSFPNYAMQAVKINFENKRNPVIYIHLDDWIHSIPDSIPFQLMTPCPKAVYLSHLFANSLSSEK